MCTLLIDISDGCCNCYNISLLFQDLQSHDDSSSTVYIDGCGEVHRLSEQAKILIPFYYLPLVIFCMLLLVKLWRRFLGEKIQQMFQKRCVCMLSIKCVYFSDTGKTRDLILVLPMREHP